MEKITEALDERVRTFPIPGSAFNYLAAEERAKFGLPARPDPELQPLQHTLWLDTFSRPLRPVEVIKPIATVEETRVSYVRALAAVWPRRQTSTNWSGAYVKPRDGRVMSQITGTWAVPAIVAGRPTGAHFGVSTWVGLDGQRRYYQSSLPQMGTGHYIRLVNGQEQAPEYRAWFQWWHRESPLQRPGLLPVGLQPGHVVRCTLTVLSGRAAVNCFIVNLTTNDWCSVDILPPAIDLRVAGATAEWVTERPSIFPTSDAYAFPDYGKVEFLECLAVATKDNGTDEERRLGGSRILNMYERRAQPSRTAKISAARLRRRVDATRVATNYL
jgi:hypothetical protein